MKTFGAGLEAARYLLPTVKALELTCGLALVAGRFVPLATVLLAPIIVNILAFHQLVAGGGSGAIMEEARRASGFRRRAIPSFPGADPWPSK